MKKQHERDKVTEKELSVHPKRMERVRGTGKQFKHLSVGTDRKNWAKTDPFAGLDQQLIQRLIEQVNSRLKRVDSHINQYQEEKDELIEQLEALKAIQSAVESQGESEEE